MVSVGKHSQATCGGVSHRLHRFTRILGTGKKDTNHTDVAQEKSVTIRGICGKTFSQEKSVRICEIRGTTSLKQRAEESPTDYADLHGYWVREKGHESHGRSIRKICDNPWNLWETFSQAKSVRICEICGKTSLKLRTEEPPTDYADLHGYWVRRKRTRITRCSTRNICDNP